MSHFPQQIRKLPKFDGAENLGIITDGELVLTVNGDARDR